MSLGYRRSEPGDLVFVVSSWVSSYRASDSAGMIAAEDWAAVMEPQVRKVLARAGGEVWVAYHPGETDHTADLYGWLAIERGHEQLLVHYCYVKSSYRRMGIARGLFRAAGIDPAQPFLHTCGTPTSLALRRQGKTPMARWSPGIARSSTTTPRPRGDHGRHADTETRRTEARRAEAHAPAVERRRGSAGQP